MTKNSLAERAVPGAIFEVRVTPNARANRVVVEGSKLKISVTAIASDGQANAAVVKLLSQALGVPKSRLTLVQGHRGRDKRFRLD